MHRTNQRHRFVAIVEGAADFLDEPDEHRIRHDAVRPKAFVQLGFFDDARSGVDEQGQQLERLRRQMDLATLAQQLAARSVELARANRTVTTMLLVVVRRILHGAGRAGRAVCVC